ncbi:FxsA family protein [Parvularcula sp. LCG005]|uniref:FxsA family protein n=1 Tax=Parvularcula sp. LCG005 TaxID=3078805 RepID=UPI0029421B62|nr:FxsA family protein [Parvularcula sp. LCG005]WOI53272.1 FxsA family protein [Parvularcula sp. LCG005]
MALLIFAVLFGLPILEVAVFLKAADAIGWLNVIFMTILTAVAGTAIIRWQGLAAIRELQRTVADGRPPVAPAVDGVFLLLAAPLMMTPGFVTDTLGFLLLVPPVRHAIARWALGKLKRSMDNGRVTIIRPR